MLPKHRNVKLQRVSPNLVRHKDMFLRLEAQYSVNDALHGLRIEEDTGIRSAKRVIHADGLERAPVSIRNHGSAKCLRFHRSDSEVFIRSKEKRSAPSIKVEKL